MDTIKITDDDAAFILGKGGKTKEKARPAFSLVRLHLDSDLAPRCGQVIQIGSESKA